MLEEQKEGQMAWGSLRFRSAGEKKEGPSQVTQSLAGHGTEVGLESTVLETTEDF